MADPVKKDAHYSIEAIEGLAELALHEPLREWASAGLANTRERLFLRAFAHDRELRPDAPFTDQAQPGYSGPDAKRDGTPVAPFPEPHDPERDRLRKISERHRDGVAGDAWLAANGRRRGGEPPADEQTDGGDSGE